MNQQLKARYLNDGVAVTPKPQLVVKLYERLVRDLEDAVSALTDSKIEPGHTALVHAQEIVHELNMSLNIDAWDGADRLRSIYTHLLSRLLEANRSKSAPIALECLELVRPLTDAWREALVLCNGGVPGFDAVKNPTASTSVRETA